VSVHKGEEAEKECALIWIPCSNSWAKCTQKTKKKKMSCSFLDPDPDLIRIQSGQWIQNPDPDTGGKNDNKNIKKCCRAEGFVD
jgi:hypothetical protein